EADDFIFDTGAIARAGGLDLAGIHGGAMEIGADDFVDLFVGFAEVAVDLRQRRRPAIGKNCGTQLVILSVLTKDLAGIVAARFFASTLRMTLGRIFIQI